MSVLQPPSGPGRSYRHQVYGIVFDHTSGMVSIDCVDPDETATGIVKNTRFDVDGRLTAEIREKVELILSAAADLAAACDEALP